MANETPKITLLGKGSRYNSAYVKDLINAIDPSNIPGHMLYNVMVELSDGSKFKISPEYFMDGVSYQNIDKQLLSIGVNKNYANVEVVIDLDKMHEALEIQAGELLNQYFH